MKHIKSLAALLLALVLALVPFAGVLAEGEPAAEEWDQLPLGNAHYAIKAPAGFFDSGVTDEEFAEGMVACYLSPLNSISIDVYQYSPAADGFEAFAKAKCEDYLGEDIMFSEHNGLPLAGFRKIKELESGTLNSVVVIVDAGEYYIETDYMWSAAEEGDAELAQQIAMSIDEAETEKIRLGSSPYYVTLTKGYYQGEITSEEAARGLVAYYLNDNLLFDFDVYENTVDEALTLADVARMLCAMDQGSDLQERSFNGIPAFTFTGKDEYDGVVYDTVTAVLESTNGSIVAVVCWIDDEPMRYAAMGMLESIATEDELIPDEPMALRIGSSDYAITLPTTFVKGFVPEEDFQEEGYAACYYSPNALFDIDFYQRLIADELPTLAEFTEKDAADYNGTEIALEDQINGVTVTSYRSAETYDNTEYKCATYTFADELYYYQLCFYWTDDDAIEDIEAAMETLAPIETTTLQLGSYTVTVPVGLEAKPIEYEDEPELTATSYKLYPLKFNVYEMKAPEKPYTLEEVAKQEVEYYNGTGLAFGDNGGIPMASYYYTRTDADSNRYAILTYCMETPDGYMDIDFEIDDYVGMFQALDVIASITPAA